MEVRSCKNWQFTELLHYSCSWHTIRLYAWTQTNPNVSIIWVYYRKKRGFLVCFIGALKSLSFMRVSWASRVCVESSTVLHFWLIKGTERCFKRTAVHTISISTEINWADRQPVRWTTRSPLKSPISIDGTSRCLPISRVFFVQDARS